MRRNSRHVLRGERLDWKKLAVPRLEFTFDSYPRKSGVQDLNLFKSDVGSENACVKDKMRTFPVFQSCLAALGSSIQNVPNLGFWGTNRMNSTLGKYASSH